MFNVCYAPTTSFKTPDFHVHAEEFRLRAEHVVVETFRPRAVTAVHVVTEV